MALYFLKINDFLVLRQINLTWNLSNFWTLLPRYISRYTFSLKNHMHVLKWRLKIISDSALTESKMDSDELALTELIGKQFGLPTPENNSDPTLVEKWRQAAKQIIRSTVSFTYSQMKTVTYYFKWIFELMIWACALIGQIFISLDLIGFRVLFNDHQLKNLS